MKPFWRWLSLVAAAMLLLQLFFVARIAAMLVILGLFPSVAGVIQAVPEPVLGGAAMALLVAQFAAAAFVSPISRVTSVLNAARQN